MNDWDPPSPESTSPVLGKVLLVEDEPELRRVFRRALLRGGFEVVEAANGSIAIELARDGSFDVVISDLRMPAVDGLQLLDALADEAPNLPVLLVSGSADLPNAAAARQCGAFGYLQKPVELAELRSSASRAVAARRRRLDIAESERESGILAIAPSASHRLGKVRGA